MKTYQIAGKHYAVIGEELYEKLPEFDPLATIVDDTTIVATVGRTRKSTYFPTKAKKANKTKVRTYVPKQGYKKGVCGKCGEEGHNAWKCPQRKSSKVVLAKDARSKKVLDRALGKARAKYDSDEVVTLARRVANKGLTPQEAAAKLGVNIASWYYLRKKYAGGVVAKQEPKAAAVLNADEIREKVVELQERNKNSLQIAQELHIPLSTVNKYWVRDRLADASDDDVPEEEDPVEQEEEDELN